MSSEIIQQIEDDIAKAKKRIALADALERLQNSKDFKALITEGYLQSEAIRLVHLKADQSFQSPASQESILKQIDGVGSLHEYFISVAQRAGMARKEIEASEEARDAILNEDINND